MQPPDHEGTPRDPAPAGAPATPDRPPGQATADATADAAHNPSLDGLGGKLRRGAQYAAFALLFTQLISLAQTVVVARLLSPAEIGVFTLGTMFANFAVTVADGGMRAAVVQREKDVADAAETAFWASLITGTIMALGALAASPLLTLIFDDNRMVGLICAATCGTLLIHSLVNVPEAMLQRTFNFKRRLIVDPTTAATFAIVTVVAILSGFGVWGMVAGLYASQLATLIACWAMSSWRPGRGRPSFRMWRELAVYSFPLIVSTLVDNTRDLLQSGLVGRGLGADGAGQYRYGRRIGVLPGRAIIQVVSYVLFPAFARIAADIRRFHHGFLRSLRMLWAITIPVAAILIVLGQPMTVVLLGEEWRPAGVFVSAMAGYGPGAAMAAIGIESIKGAGASRRIHWLTGLSIVVGLGGLILLIPYGLLGVGIAVSIDAVVGGLASLALAMGLATVTVRELVAALVPPAIAAALAGGAVGFLEMTIVHADRLPIVLGVLALAGESILLLALFGGLLFLLAPRTAREVLGALRRRAGGTRGTGGGDDDAGSDEGSDDDPDGPDGPDGAAARRRRELLDAPTVVLALSYLDGAAARRPVPPRRPAGPPLPAPPGLDAPTTALPGTTPPADPPPGRARRLVPVTTRRGARPVNGHAPEEPDDAETLAHHLDRRTPDA